MTTQHAASCRLSIQRTGCRVRVIYNLEVRERSEDLNALIPGGTVTYHGVSVRAEIFWGARSRDGQTIGRMSYYKLYIDKPISDFNATAVSIPENGRNL
jgi:hypothetical protein